MANGSVDIIDGGIETQMHEELLFTTYMAEYENWRALNLEVDCWSDPGKRLPMLHARIRCQDAKLAYLYRHGDVETDRVAGA